MNIGLYAGSFDPITKGHLAVIRQALKVVDKLHVVVAVNPDKKGMFDMPERVGLINKDRIVVDSITNMLTVTYARLVDAKILVRGLRNGADYAYERSQAAINWKLAPEIETIFIPTPVDYEEVSSSTVKGLMKLPGGEVAASEFVTPSVLAAIQRKSLF
jgi:pantetheine-phosphate adenylyltransferase